MLNKKSQEPKKSVLELELELEERERKREKEKENGLKGRLFQ